MFDCLLWFSFDGYVAPWSGSLLDLLNYSPRAVEVITQYDFVYVIIQAWIKNLLS